MTSLIDVLFLMLIFFMLTSTFRRRGEMQLELPSSSTSNPTVQGANRSTTEIVLQADGSLLINGELTAQEAAVAKLRAAHEEDPQRAVLLKAAADARHADVVRLYDLVREVGFPGFSLATEIQAPRAGDRHSRSRTESERGNE
jgi:biopolymer transport protein ExbD